MKIIISVLAALGVLIGGFFLLSQPSTESSPQVTAAQSELTIEQVNTDLEDGALLLDVRTPEEFAAGYIERAELFPLQDLQQGNYPTVPKDTKIYVYCRSGNRSVEARNILLAAGFTDVIDLGGVPDVQAIGGKLIR
jgi:rhodanese-related sulfurtransferase